MRAILLKRAVPAVSIVSVVGLVKGEGTLGEISEMTFGSNSSR